MRQHLDLNCVVACVKLATMKPIPIIEKLVWDYDIPPDAQKNEAFRRWCIVRVLSHGTAAGVRMARITNL